MRPLRALLTVSAAACLLAHVADAGVRGAFDPITLYSNVQNGFEQPALRPVPAQDGIERFFCFTTRSTVYNYETSRQIWLHVNKPLAGLGVAGPDLNAVRVPILYDPTGVVSYVDPAWSPDGRFLAYVKTDRYASSGTIFVQEYRVSDDLGEAATPVGSPITVVSGADGSHNRHPDWSPDGSTLVFESDRSRVALALYTVQVFPTIGEPVAQTDERFPPEFSPAYSRDGTRLAYLSNAYGPPQIFILDLTTPFPHSTMLAETKLATSARRDPAWASDGKSIYFAAPAEDNPEEVADVFRVDLTTHEPCPIFFDQGADWDPDVSRYEHRSPEGLVYNYFLYTSTALATISPVPNIWRAEYLETCVPPLPMTVDFQPSSLKFGSSGNDVVVTLGFTPEGRAAGYQCQSFNGPLEGVATPLTIMPSPSIYGLAPDGNHAQVRQFGQATSPELRNYTVSGDPRMDVRWNRAALESVLIAHGEVNRIVGIPVRAYSINVGRSFLGYGYIKLSSSSLGAQLSRAQDGAGDGPSLSASPNPFNPETAIHFHTAAPGEVTLRLFDSRGRLVRTLVRQWFPEGDHETRWDGRDSRGGGIPSGLYFAELATAQAAPVRLKLLLLK